MMEKKAGQGVGVPVFFLFCFAQRRRQGQRPASKQAAAAEDNYFLLYMKTEE